MDRMLWKEDAAMKPGGRMENSPSFSLDFAKKRVEFRDKWMAKYKKHVKANKKKKRNKKKEEGFWKTVVKGFRFKE